MPLHDARYLRDKVDDDKVSVSDDDAVCPNDLFWTRQELLVSRKRAQLKASVIRSKFPLEVETLEHAIKNCLAVTVAVNIERKGFRVDNADSIPVDDVASCLPGLKSDSKDITALYNWSSSYVRGLEDYVTSLLSSERHDVIRHFLLYQESLRRENDPSTSIEAALCERSRKLSRRAREFAFNMAIGDALTAIQDP
jgi:hypothetical protein